jgi:hypothetical protein
VSVERVIPAPADQIFDVLANPAMHPVLDGSGTVRSAPAGNPERLSLGAKFGMGMRLVGPYRTRNTVVEFEEGRRIAWHHPARNTWRYELDPVDGGTRVRESFDYSRSRAAWFVRLFKFAERNRAGMEKTLENLERHLAGPA